MGHPTTPVTAGSGAWRLMACTQSARRTWSGSLASMSAVVTRETVGRDVSVDDVAHHDVNARVNVAQVLDGCNVLGRVVKKLDVVQLVLFDPRVDPGGLDLWIRVVKRPDLNARH